MNNLITSLLIFINNPEVRDTDYQIASCLLSHCHDIRHMTIQELAEKSYVSVSTINRFLKIFGFSRYSIFKEVLNHTAGRNGYDDVDLMIGKLARYLKLCQRPKRAFSISTDA